MGYNKITLKNKLFTVILKNPTKFLLISITILILLVSSFIQCSKKNKASAKELNTLKDVAVPTSTSCASISSWIGRTASEENDWYGITYGKNQFVAVAGSGTNRVMTSPDGITWTSRVAAEQNSWNKVIFGNDIYVAITNIGTNRIMTSTDGITWISRTAPEQNQWV